MTEMLSEMRNAEDVQVPPQRRRLRIQTMQSGSKDSARWGASSRNEESSVSVQLSNWEIVEPKRANPRARATLAKGKAITSPTVLRSSRPHQATQPLRPQDSPRRGHRRQERHQLQGSQEQWCLQEGCRLVEVSHQDGHKWGPGVISYSGAVTGSRCHPGRRVSGASGSDSAGGGVHMITYSL